MTDFLSFPADASILNSNSSTRTIVVNGIETTQSRAESSVNLIEPILSKVSNALDALTSLQSINVELGQISATVDAYVSPVKPTRVAINTAFPAAIALVDPKPNFAPLPPGTKPGSVQTLTIDPIPVMATSEPTLQSIPLPSPFAKAAPVVRAIPERSYPVKPTTSLPTAPVMRTLDPLPEAPQLLDIQFEGMAPLLETPPTTHFNFTDAEYQSLLTTTLKDKLLDWLLNVNATGLSEGVLQRVWDQGRERTGAQERKLHAMARKRFASLGWNVAPGDEIQQLKQATQDAVNLDVTENRTITVARANLEQTNAHFAFTNALSLEHELMVLHDAAQNRSLEAEKYAVQSVIDLWQIKASYFNAGVTLYGTQADVYGKRTQAELNKLERTKAQLEIKKTLGTLNEQDLTNYGKQIDAVVAIHGLYTAELQGVKTQLEGDALVLQQTESDIKLWLGEIQAKGLEYEGYKAAMSGEESKANLYNALSGAFGKRVDAWKSQHDIKGLKLEKDIQLAIDTPLKLGELTNQVYKIQNEAEASRLEALTKLNDSRAEVYKSTVAAVASELDARVSLDKNAMELYSAEVGAESARIGAQVSVQDAQVKREVASSDIRVKSLTANITAMLSKVELILGALKAEVQVRAQLAASALSAVNYGASLNMGESLSRGVSFGNNWSSSNANNTSHGWSTNTSKDPDVHYTDSTSHDPDVHYTDSTSHTDDSTSP